MTRPRCRHCNGTQLLLEYGTDREAHWIKTISCLDCGEVIEYVQPTPEYERIRVPLTARRLAH